MDQRPVDDVAVADHPADIGAAPPDLAGLDAVEIEHRPFQRDQMPAIVAHHALRNAGGAGGVEDVERIGRQHRHAGRGSCRLRARRGAIPPSRDRGPAMRSQACCGRCRMMQASRLDAGEFDRLVEQRLVLHDAAGLEPAARREDQFWLGVLDPGGEFFGGKAAEHHRMHRADPRAGQHRDHGFRHHRHIEDDAVALGDAEILHHGGQRLHLVQHLGIGEFGDGVGAAANRGSAPPGRRGRSRRGDRARCSRC